MKKRMVSLLIVCMLFVGVIVQAAVVSSYAPYANIEYSYSSSVKSGTVRYMSQVSGGKYFYSNYWGTWASQASIECGTCSISMALSYIGINKTPQDILNEGNGLTYFGKNWGGLRQKVIQQQA